MRATISRSVVESWRLPAKTSKLQRLALFEHAVQRSIAAVVVDLRLGHVEQIVQRRAAKPILGDVQLARRLAQPRDDQYRRHRGPRHIFASAGQQPRQQLIQPQRLPQSPRQRHIAETSATFQEQATEIERDRSSR